MSNNERREQEKRKERKITCKWYQLSHLLLEAFLYSIRCIRKRKDWFIKLFSLISFEYSHSSSLFFWLFTSVTFCLSTLGVSEQGGRYSNFWLFHSKIKALNIKSWCSKFKQFQLKEIISNNLQVWVECYSQFNNKKNRRHLISLIWHILNGMHLRLKRGSTFAPLLKVLQVINMKWSLWKRL